jgi:hypothetical protein
VGGTTATTARSVRAPRSPGESARGTWQLRAGYGQVAETIVRLVTFSVGMSPRPDMLEPMPAPGAGGEPGEADPGELGDVDPGDAVPGELGDVAPGRAALVE